MIPFAERRAQKRYIGGALHGSILHSNDLKVLNISISGAAIETVRRVELNREYAVKLQHRERSLVVRARVVWAMLVSREMDDHRIVPLYRSGVRFRELSDEQADFIRNSITAAGTEAREDSPSRISYCF